MLQHHSTADCSPQYSDLPDNVIAFPQVTAEQWLPVVDWEGLYEVSSTGRVRSVPRRIEARDGRVFTFTEYRVLRQRVHPDGYRIVNLREGHRRHIHIAVHNLVAAAFLGPRPDGQMVLHWNDDGADNRVENLRYGTFTENALDAVRNGRNRQANQTHCKRDHVLSGPNVRHPDPKHPHRRGCIACMRGAQTAMRHGKAGDEATIRALADAHYVAILQEAGLLQEQVAA